MNDILTITAQIKAGAPIINDDTLKIAQAIVTMTVTTRLCEGNRLVGGGGTC